MAAAIAGASRGGTTSAVSPSTAYSRQPPLSVVTSGVPHASASRPGWQKPSNQLPTANTRADAYSRPERGLVEVLADVALHLDAEQVRGLDDRVGALPRPLLVAAAQQRVALGPGIRVERVAVDAAQLHRGPVTGLGRDLVGGPVAVRQLEVDRRARRSPSFPPCRRRGRSAAHRTRAGAPARTGPAGATAARG